MRSRWRAVPTGGDRVRNATPDHARRHGTAQGVSVVVLTGPPGAGQNTVTRRLADRLRAGSSEALVAQRSREDAVGRVDSEADTFVYPDRAGDAVRVNVETRHG